MTAMQAMWVALAGAGGALARVGLTQIVQRLTGTTFPLATLVINVLGSAALGVVVGLSARGGGDVRLIIGGGFLGAFTTFSTFAVDTQQMLERRQWTLALLNVAGSVTAGVLAAWWGLRWGRHT